jgi:uncharacterized protein
MKLSRVLSFAILVALPAIAREPDIRVQTNVMVPMRDGVKLATDIYLPPGKPRSCP